MTSKDPPNFTVLFEDSAALIGLLVALGGVFLSHQFDSPYFDGSASIVIGVILAAVAVFLAYETKGLLIGEGADKDIVESIRRLADSDSSVRSVHRLLTMHFGPHTILITMALEFRDDLSTPGMERAVNRIEKQIREHYPDVKHVFIESQSLASNRKD